MISHMKSQQNILFTNNIYGYNTNIVYEHSLSNFLKFSGGLGYVKTGRSMEIFSGIFGDKKETLYLYINNLQCSSTIQLKLYKNKLNVYIGIGPKIDIPINNKYYKDNNKVNMEKDYIGNKLQFGYKAEIGFDYSLKRLLLGTKVSFLNNLTKHVTGNLSNSCYTINLSLGYML